MFSMYIFLTIFFLSTISTGAKWFSSELLSPSHWRTSKWEKETNGTISLLTRAFYIFCADDDKFIRNRTSRRNEQQLKFMYVTSFLRYFSCNCLYMRVTKKNLPSFGYIWTLYIRRSQPNKWWRKRRRKRITRKNRKYFELYTWMMPVRNNTQ